MNSGTGDDTEISGFDHNPDQLNVINGEFYYVYNYKVYKMNSGTGDDTEISGFDHNPDQLNIQ